MTAAEAAARGRRPPRNYVLQVESYLRDTFSPTPIRCLNLNLNLNLKSSMGSTVMPKTVRPSSTTGMSVSGG